MCLKTLTARAEKVSVPDEFKRLHITPALEPVAPEGELTVVYGHSRAKIQADLGKDVHELAGTSLRPNTVTWPAEPDTYYTLFMIDADAKGPNLTVSVAPGALLAACQHSRRRHRSGR